MSEADGAAAACPSAPAAPGASLIGIVQDGQVVKLGTPLTIDADFIGRASGEASLESRFRFSDRCREGGCSHWAANACSLIDRLERSISDELALSAKPALPAISPSGLPPCAIRGSCRWWAQRGAAACAICDFVVTDTSGAAL